MGTGRSHARYKADLFHVRVTRWGRGLVKMGTWCPGKHEMLVCRVSSTQWGISKRTFELLLIFSMITTPWQRTTLETSATAIRPMFHYP